VAPLDPAAGQPTRITIYPILNPLAAVLCYALTQNPT
jgi:hypothetical protein